MLTVVKKIAAFIFLAGSVLGLLGLPADLATWYRRAQDLLPSRLDGSTLFNVTMLVVGLLLLVPSSSWEHLRRLVDRTPLALLDRMRDGRAIVRAGRRVIELDAYAWEHWPSFDANEARRISRMLATGTRDSYSRYDLIAIRDGHPIDDGVFRVEGTVKGVRFWTRAEIAAMSPTDREVLKINSPLWRWYTGEDADDRPFWGREPART